MRENSLKLLQKMGVNYTPPAPYVLSAAKQKVLVGRYLLSGENVAVVHLADGALTIDFMGIRGLKISPLDSQNFTTTKGMFVEFDRSKDPIGLVLRGRGMRFVGGKIR